VRLDDRAICAIATASGKGAIGVVRVSGPRPEEIDAIADAVVGAVGGANASANAGRKLQPRSATYGPFLAGDRSVIDYGLALLFPAPHSYTGETVLELQGHGGPVVMQMLLQRVLDAGREAGLRLARPGEFTERAFLNDKLDLAQAEAVSDLIEASTEQAARSATRSLQGLFSGQITELAEQLLALRMLVEATLDFPEEEIEFLESANALGRLAAIEAQLQKVLATARQGALLRQGLSVVLVGAPNVGKSSLLNALAGAEVAIVTPIAGTTRDRVTQAIAIDGVPLNIIDTAGLRETDDPIERIGIERTWAEVERADVVVHLVDGSGAAAAPAGAAPVAASPADGVVSEQARQADEELFRLIDARAPAGAARITVVNKIDLAGEAPGAVDGQVRLSALTGEGIDLMRAALLRAAGFQPGAEDVFTARERHLQALREALEHVALAQGLGQGGDRALDLFAEELRLAHRALGQITGEVTADDLLGVIFSRFCIGK
jgi:tRNA modification GTPase